MAAIYQEELIVRKIKILQFAIVASKGGKTRYALRNWKYIDKSKFQFDFVTFNKHLDYEQELIDEGCRVYYMSCCPEENREQFIEEFDAVLNNGYDAIHIYTGYWRDTIVEERAKRNGIKKIIVHATNSQVNINDEQKRIRDTKIHNVVKKKINLSLATDFCTCSDLATEWLFGEQIPREIIKRFNMAIDIDEYVYNPKIRDEYRRKLGIADCIVLGHVGRFAYQKNHEFLINVLAKVSKVIDNIKLVLMGSGVLKEEIKSLVDSLGLEKKVIFVGTSEDVAYRLQAMDIFCFPSRFEGLPAALVEAQASGLKCLVSDCITAEVCITENIKRIPLNIDIWVNNIIDLAQGYDRKDMSSEMTNAGYNIKYQIKELEKLYLPN